MITLEELEAEIESEEEKEPTYSGLTRLASMYVVRNELKGNAHMNELSGSEFLDACSETDLVLLFDILNEHMDAIKIVCPKEYQAVLKKIQLIKDV